METATGRRRSLGLWVHPFERRCGSAYSAGAVAWRECPARRGSAWESARVRRRRVADDAAKVAHEVRLVGIAPEDGGERHLAVAELRHGPAEERAEASGMELGGEHAAATLEPAHVTLGEDAGHRRAAALEHELHRWVREHLGDERLLHLP